MNAFSFCFCFIALVIHKSNNKSYRAHSASVVNQKLLLSKCQGKKIKVISVHSRPWARFFDLSIVCLLFIWGHIWVVCNYNTCITVPEIHHGQFLQWCWWAQWQSRPLQIRLDTLSHGFIYKMYINFKCWGKWSQEHQLSLGYIYLPQILLLGWILLFIQWSLRNLELFNLPYL